MLYNNSSAQVSTHVALDHLTYSTSTHSNHLDSSVKCDEHSRVGRWRFGLNNKLIQQTLWLTRPATYKKSKQWCFEKNRVMFRPHFDPFMGIWGIPDQHKNESLHKNDCCIVLSEIRYLKMHIKMLIGTLYIFEATSPCVASQARMFHKSTILSGIELALS